MRVEWKTRTRASYYRIRFVETDRYLTTDDMSNEEKMCHGHILFYTTRCYVEMALEKYKEVQQTAGLELPKVVVCSFGSNDKCYEDHGVEWC